MASQSLPERRGADIVVTIPKHLWTDWLEEGDLPGDKWGGDYWSYYTSGAFPAALAMTGKDWAADAFGPTADDRVEGNSPGQERVWTEHLAGVGDERAWRICAPDQRCYIVAHGRLRGYAPLFAVEVDPAGRLKAFIRRGGAVAVTIPEPIQGFRSWRYRWWGRATERPFPLWKEPMAPIPPAEPGEGR